MGGLGDIPVQVAAPPAVLSPQGLALLHELRGHLAELAAGGRGAVIDLRGLPLAPGDRDALRRLLGEGEVRATVHALGPSRFVETAVPGLWWVTHCNDAGDTVTEFIEIGRVPALLAADPRELEGAAARLDQLIGRATAELEEPDER